MLREGNPRVSADEHGLLHLSSAVVFHPVPRCRAAHESRTGSETPPLGLTAVAAGLRPALNLRGRA